MNIPKLSLDNLSIGQSCRILGTNTVGNQHRRMLDLGLIRGTKVKALHKSPLGEIVAYSVRGSVIALRSEDAQNIFIELCD